MADVGLDSDLVLDIRQALQRVGDIERALDRATNVQMRADARLITQAINAAVDAADENVTVTGDAVEITGDINAAVDAADSAVEVTGEAGDVTGSIDAAVDAADAAVEVTGEAAEVTGSIDGAVDAADSHVVITGEAGSVRGAIESAVASSSTEVRISANPESVNEAKNAVGELGAEIAGARTEAAKFGSVLAAVAGGAIVGGLFLAAQAASDLAESQSKANVVFGDGIGVVTEFATTASVSVGLSNQAALEAAGTFGNLFTALGLTQSAAASLAPDVIQLGADLASFNNLGVEDTLERIRSGLVGEIEPLRSIGISFNAADVEARAFELGLAGANGELSEGAKVQARWSLIVEQSSNAAGDFARTSDGLANQQRILAAEFQNAVTQAGQHLLPTLLDLVGVGREQLIPAFSQIAEQVLPPLASAFTSLLPAVSGFSNIIVGLAPVLELLATLLGAIPPDVLVLGATFFAATRVVGVLTSELGSLQTRLANSRFGATRLGQSLSGASGVSGGALLAAAGLTVLTFALQQNAEAAARNRQRIQTLATSMGEGETTAEGLAEGLEQLSADGDKVVGSLSGTGVTIDELSAAVAAGVDPWVVLGRSIEAALDSGDLAGLGLARLAENIRDASEQQVLAAQRADENTAAMANAAIAASTYTESYGDLNVQQVDYVAANARLQEALREEQEGRNEAARATIEHGLATGQFTQTQADAALASEDVAAALEELQAQTADYVSTAELARDVLASVQDVSGATADATRRYGEALADLNGKQVPTNEALTRFALAAADGAITEEQLGAAAQALGVNLADLQGFIDNVSGAVNEFADTAIGTLPTVSGIIGDLGEDFSAQALLDELREVTAGILEFEENLALLAAFPNVQRTAAENGPLVAAALAEPIREGNTQVLAELEAQLGLYDDVYGQLDEKLREEIGPNIAVGTGQVAEDASTAFGENFDPQAKAQQALDDTSKAVVDFTAVFADVMDIFGGSGEKSFTGAIAPIPASAGRAASDAAGAVVGRIGAASGAGKALGGAVKSGVGVGIDGTPGLVARAAEYAAGAAASKAGSGSASGKVLGSAIMGGVAAGVSAGRSKVINSIGAELAAAVSSAKKALGIFSPSKVFADIGSQVSEGLVVGIMSEIAAVENAATAVALSAVAAARAPLATLAPEVAADASSVIGGGTTLLVEEGAVQIAVSGADPVAARRAGTEAGRGFLDVLAGRQIIVRARTG